MGRYSNETDYSPISRKRIIEKKDGKAEGAGWTGQDSSGIRFVWFVIKCRKNPRRSSTSVKNLQDRHVNRTTVFRNFIQIGHKFDADNIVFPKSQVTWVADIDRSLSKVCGRRVYTDSVNLTLVYQPRDCVHMPAWEVKRRYIGVLGASKYLGFVRVLVRPTGIHDSNGIPRHLSELLLPHHQVLDRDS